MRVISTPGNASSVHMAALRIPDGALDVRRRQAVYVQAGIKLGEIPEPGRKAAGSITTN
jgi:hypothetical protein